MSTHPNSELLLIEVNPDDEELTLHALRASRIGNHITIIRDGGEALDYIFATGRSLESLPHLILIDVQVGNWQEVVERLKKDSRTQRIPIVALTGSRDEAAMQKGRELGINSYIIKPVDFEKFSNAIKNLGLYWLILKQPHSPV